MLELAIAALAGALMCAAHYLTPRILGRTLHRIEAYLVGCGLGVFLPFTAWWVLIDCQSHGWQAPLTLLAIMAGAGIGTGLGYIVDDRAGCKAEGRLDGKP